MSYPTKNVTVRCYEIDADAIQRAADRASKTLSDYCRDILIPWAYSDLGERRPQLPPLERGRYSSMLEKAAKAAGVDAATFARDAVETAAAQALGLAASSKAEAPAERLHRRDSGIRELSPTHRRKRTG
jgi:uncharacterized protein (DUF1778 family)